jgi:hypothetical protein
MVVQGVGAWAEEDQQQESEAEHHRLLAVVDQRKEAVREVHGEVRNRHLIGCEERSDPG